MQRLQRTDERVQSVWWTAHPGRCHHLQAAWHKGRHSHQQSEGLCALERGGCIFVGPSIGPCLWFTEAEQLNMARLCSGIRGTAWEWARTTPYLQSSQVLLYIRRQSTSGRWAPAAATSDGECEVLQLHASQILPEGPLCIYTLENIQSRFYCRAC